MATKIEFDTLRKQFGSIVAVEDVSITIPAGDFVTLVGPSGCGKTTTLRMIAGLETPTSGTIRFDGTDVTNEPPQNRPISMVFQNTALYPHMTCRENIGYGLKIRGVPKADRDERIEEAAEVLQIPDQLDKMPAELSGGQQQRVALGRAFVENPDVLLLDEPMSDLDAKLKEELRVEIQRLHRNLDATMIYVTHDQNEAMTMSDRIALMDSGTVAQYDSPETVFRHPVSEYVATFIGTPTTNILEYQVDGTSASRGDSHIPLPHGIEANGSIHIGVRPQFLSVGGGELEFDVTVDVIEPLGVEYVLHATEVVGDQDIDIIVNDATDVSPGDTIRIGTSLEDVFIFDSAGQAVAYGTELADSVGVEGT